MIERDIGTRAKGLFAGIDLTGASISQNTDDTTKLYGAEHSFDQILHRSVPRPPLQCRSCKLCRNISGAPDERSVPQRDLRFLAYSHSGSGPFFEHSAQR